MGNCIEPTNVQKDHQVTHESTTQDNGALFLSEIQRFENKNEQLKGSLNPSFKSIVVNTNSEYKGEIRFEKADGKGKFETNNYTYEGNWKGGKPTGYGELRYKDGSYYKGQFVNSRPEGEGEYFVYGNFEYKGHFKEGLFDGFGEVEWNNGQRYEGQFDKGKFDGDGKFYWPDGRIFTGKYNKGRKNGPGVVELGQGIVFEGEWIDGERVGKGTLKRHGVVINK